MMLLGWIIAFTLLGGVLSVLAASVFLLIPERTRHHVLPGMVSFAMGALLGAALLAVLPHALEAPGIRGAHTLTGVVLLPIVSRLTARWSAPLPLRNANDTVSTLNAGVGDALPATPA